jgi:death on curing protein
MLYLELDEALQIHERAIQRYGGSPELRDLGLLESALAAPKQTMFGEDLYPDVAAQAAILVFSLVKNHPFMDGNKRTGFLCLMRFLQVNDYALDATNDDLYQFTLDVATSVLDKEQVTAWIRMRLRSAS